MIPYGRQTIDESDIESVLSVLKSDWLTTGPKVEQFENAISRKVSSHHAVAVSSGTAALHATMHALGISKGDEVIIPAITFAATANCVLFEGGTPVFADIDPSTLLISPVSIEKHISDSTKAIICVDYAGQPCDYDTIRKIANRHGIRLVADACHALGAAYKGQRVGTLADLTVFSFHPVKHITTGEGGMVVTDDSDLADHIQIFRNHGITSGPRQRLENKSWYYEMVDLGYNYRISDIQCALGVSQLEKLNKWIRRRNNLAICYDEMISKIKDVKPLSKQSNVLHAYHLYVVLLDEKIDRDHVFEKMRSKNIGVNVHYIPVYLHPYYRNQLGTYEGLCPDAEAAFSQMLTLPLYPGMTEQDVKTVCEALMEAI